MGDFIKPDLAQLVVILQVCAHESPLPLAAGDNQECTLLSVPLLLIKPLPSLTLHPHLQVAVHADGHPVGQHLLHDRLRAPQHQLGVLGGRGIDQIHQQVFHDAGVVLEFTMEGDGEQGCQAASDGSQGKQIIRGDKRAQTRLCKHAPSGCGQWRVRNNK